MDFFNNQIRELIVKNIEIDKNFQYEQFKVGRSNITFKIFDDKNSYVLRRPPYGNKLESAHNMSREYRIIDESIANRGNYTFQIYASPLVLQNTGDALFVGTGDFESTGAGATCTFMISGYRES